MTHGLPHWLEEPALQQFFAATHKAGGEARAVGGAVRDFLQGMEGGDVDIASTLLPAQTMDLAAARGWKAVPTGLAHGTVTLVLPGGRVIEVTTLRRDVETDGRHATVAFTDDFEQDAARRDFTINALYMDAQGQVYDYFRGREDVEARRVRFIGDAGTRIAEDGLRILRYFRFLATHGAAPADAAALTAITAQRQMLATLSGERIAMEMRKLLAVADPLYALAQMQEVGLAPLLVGQGWDLARLQQMLHLAASVEMPFLPWLRLMALVVPSQREAAAAWVVEHWKLSCAACDMLRYLAAPIDGVTAAQIKEWLRQKPPEWVQARLALMVADGATLPTGAPDPHHWPVPNFPVTAGDLLAQGMAQGPALGARLRDLEAQWVMSDYRLSKEALLAMSRSLNGVE